MSDLTVQVMCCCGMCDQLGHPREAIREMTVEEIAQRELDTVQAAEAEAGRLAEAEAKASELAAARQELIDLGLSEAAADAIMSSRSA